jgi:tRNA(adenine34) deaminase
VTSVELMREAIAIAQESLASNDVPVGALIIDPSGKIIATGTNEREAKSDPDRKSVV